MIKNFIATLALVSFATSAFAAGAKETGSRNSVEKKLEALAVKETADKVESLSPEKTKALNDKLDKAKAGFSDKDFAGLFESKDTKDAVLKMLGESSNSSTSDQYTARIIMTLIKVAKKKSDTERAQIASFIENSVELMKMDSSSEAGRKARTAIQHFGYEVTVRNASVEKAAEVAMEKCGMKEKTEDFIKNCLGKKS